MYGAVPPLGHVLPVCCINTQGNCELLPDALDEIIRLVFLAEEIHFKFDDDDDGDDDDSVHVY